MLLQSLLAGWRAHTADLSSAASGKPVLWLPLTTLLLYVERCCAQLPPTVPRMLGWRNSACTSCFCRYRATVGAVPQAQPSSFFPLLAGPGPHSPKHTLASELPQHFHCCDQTNPLQACLCAMPRLTTCPVPCCSHSRGQGHVHTSPPAPKPTTNIPPGRTSPGS